MYSPEQITSIIKNEIEFTKRAYRESRDRIYLESEDCLECLLDSVQPPSDASDSYILSISSDNGVIMTIGCYVNKEKQYQANMYISRHFSKGRAYKNISLLIHSYAASLFGSKHIVIREPFPKMRSILESSGLNITMIEPPSDGSEESRNEYRKRHEEILNDSADTIFDVIDGEHDTTFIVEITDEFKELYLQSKYLTFSCTKMT